jgi:arylformamidase
VSRIIDLTITIVPGMGPPNFRKVAITPFHTHETHRKSNADLSMAIHTATHIDAPFHYAADGITIDRVPLDQLIGEAVVFRLEGIATEGHRFTVPELEKVAAVTAAELKDKIVLLVTGWTNRAFDDAPRYFHDGPTLSPEAATWLAECGVKAVVLDCGTDAPDPRPVPEQAKPVHRTLLGRGIPLVENCIDLVTLPPGRCVLYAIPLKIQAESGAPARVFAVVED